MKSAVLSSVVQKVNYYEKDTNQSSWHYSAASSKRDDRIDFLRGLAILSVIINHIAISSLYRIISVEAVGVVSGAEGFVFLSGIVIGRVYQNRIQVDGWQGSSRKLLGRAWQIYVVTLIVNLLVYALSWLPLFEMKSLTFYIDVYKGVVAPLYASNTSVTTFLVNQLLLLYGPSQLNVLGLYVALIALTPLLLRLLQWGNWYSVILISWLLYATYILCRFRVLPSQSENAFPLFAWQLLFAHGIVLGYHWQQVQTLVQGKVKLVLLSSAYVLFFVFCFFALNNPWYTIPHRLRFGYIPESTYYLIYSTFFQRTALGVGRFLNTIVVVGVFYSLLTHYWMPIRRVVGWLVIPLGKASLYVFVVHIGFIVLIDNVSILQQHNVFINTAIHTMVVGLIWLMVRTQFLFRWIPR